jgi:signal transduction histidine kinase
MIFVALATALAGAATASLIATRLWQAHERRELRGLVSGLAEAVEREAAEEGTTLDVAASEALRETVTAGNRAEIWRGKDLVASSPPGPLLGPPDAAQRATRNEWLVLTRSLRDGLTLLVAAPRARVAEVFRVFGWSLILSAPVCVILALLIGRLVGRRATRPLLDFRDRIAAARPFDALPQAPPSIVSEVAQLEASFRGLWDRLREAAAREIEFAANAAHELRTPLTRIRLHAERALAGDGAASPRGIRETPGTSATREWRDLIEEIDRMVRLVDSLLILSRDAASGIPAGEVVNVSDVVYSTARRVFASGPPPRIDAPDEALVRGDEALLGIAVLNLLDNARKFSSSGRQPQVIVSGDAGGVRVTVTSPGAQIPRVDAERLFERFYRGPEARASFPGHGLGLPLARHVARLHGGDVCCVSGADEDARFELSLPAWRSLGEAGQVPIARQGP